MDTSAKKTFYLIRHTSVAIEPGICYGQSDVPCSDSFYEEADVIRRFLPPSLTCFSSPLTRCTMLAHFLYGTAVETDDRLKEISFGSWELKPWAEIPRVESDPWCDDFLESAPPGGESARVLFNRCSELMRYIEARDDGPFALVTHKGCIGAILVYLLGRPLDTILEWSCKPGGVFKIVKEDLRVQVEVVVSGSQ